MQRALFLHRSVGQNLIDDGALRNLILENGIALKLDDYNQNTDTLTTASGKQKLGLHFPDNDTKPESLAQIFGPTGSSALRPILELVARYDVVILKSCYPNSDIKNNEELKALQKSYQTIAGFFADNKQQLVIMTSPPLRSWHTSSINAARARTLNDWIKQTIVTENIHTFDLFGLLANPTTHPHANTLQKQYCRFLFFDNHPNTKASRLAASAFVDFLKRI